MKTNMAAIREAGHCLVALAHGFTIKQVYARDQSGHTEAERSVVRDEIEWLGLPGDNNRFADVQLAGLAAEEVHLSAISSGLLNRLLGIQDALFRDYQFGAVRRAEKDLQAICDLWGMNQYREVVVPYALKILPGGLFGYDPILRDRMMEVLGYGPRASSSLPADKELTSFIRRLFESKDNVKRWHFGTKRQQTVLNRLAREITKKERLSGLEVSAVVEGRRSLLKPR